MNSTMLSSASALVFLPLERTYLQINAINTAQFIKETLNFLLKNLPFF